MPAELFNMKELPPGGEEEEEEENEEEEAEKNEDNDDKQCTSIAEPSVDSEESTASMSQESTPAGQRREQPAQSHELKGAKTITSVFFWGTRH